MRVPIRISDMPASGQYEPPAEGDIARWLKHAGDRVEQGEDIFEFENDKAATTVSSPFSGTLVEICFAAGSTWHRGELVEVKNGVSVYDPPFCWIETSEKKVVLGEQSIVPHRVVGDESISMGETRKNKPRISSGAFHLMQIHSITAEELLQAFPRVTSFEEREVQTLAVSRAKDAIAETLRLGEQVIAERNEASEKLGLMYRAVPAARARAKELGIVISAVRGTGPDGLVLLADVEACARWNAHPSISVPAAVVPVDAAQSVAVPVADEEVVFLKMSPLLRKIAENMEEANDIPTVDVMPTSATFDFTALIAFYKRFHAQFDYALWFPVMVATARVLGQEEFIVFNSFCVKEDAASGTSSHPSFFVASRKRVHMGIAYDRGEAPHIDWANKTIGGEALRILVIRDANTKTIETLIRDVRRLLKTAIRKRFDRADISGYTFIFNNVGAIGHHFGRAMLGEHIGCMINLGHVDIAAGTGVLQPVFDHRLINGARSGKFVAAIHEEMIRRVLPELEAYLT